MHYGGEPVDLEKIMEIAAKYGLFVLQDVSMHLKKNIWNKIGNTDCT